MQCTCNCLFLFSRWNVNFFPVEDIALIVWTLSSWKKNHDMKIHFFWSWAWDRSQSFCSLCSICLSKKNWQLAYAINTKGLSWNIIFFLLVKIPEKQIGTVLGGHAPLANDGHVRLNPKIHFLKKITITYRVKLWIDLFMVALAEELQLLSFPLVYNRELQSFFFRIFSSACR